MKQRLGGAIRRVFRYPELWVLIVAACITRFWALGSPRAVVFDEVYARHYPSGYLSGNFFFDVHPPLGKLLFAGMATLFHLTPDQLYSGPEGTTLLRVLPALAGVAMVPLVYIVVRQLGLGRKMATLGGLMILCDNAFLVESRFALKDMIMIALCTAALSAFLKLCKTTGRKRWVWVSITSVLLGCAVSIKWPALAFIGLFCVALPLVAILHHTSWKRSLLEIAVAGIIVLAIYVGTFAVHFALLPHSGTDDGFMSEKFQSTLVGSKYYDPNAKMSFWDKFNEINIRMYTANDSLIGVHHPYESAWYEWPVEQRPVLYWIDNVRPDGAQARIYLLGNPVVWWMSAYVMFFVVGAIIFRHKWLGEKFWLVGFLFTGFVFNFAPFIPVTRQMFLYNYFLSLVCAILMTCVVMYLLMGLIERKYGMRAMQGAYGSIILIIVAVFLYFAPLSYGLPLSSQAFDAHMWLSSWR